MERLAPWGKGACPRIFPQPVNADVPIVMVTARTEDECERTALDAGVTVFVRKPVSLRSLSAGIAEALTKTPQKVLV
jgi:two-component system chemotaxis response regulator CheY/two-component system phosphate regulon response regulator PhoB